MRRWRLIAEAPSHNREAPESPGDPSEAGSPKSKQSQESPESSGSQVFGVCKKLRVYTFQVSSSELEDAWW